MTRQYPTGKPDIGYIEHTRQEVIRVLKDDRGHAIYNYFGFTPSISRPQVKNPFREERTISFYIHPEGYFIDFGDDSISGDSIDFIKRYCDVGFNDAIKIAAGIYNIEYNGVIAPDIKSITPSKKTAYKKEYKSNNLNSSYKKLYFRDYLTGIEKEYWKEKTGSTPKTVLKYFKPIAGIEMQFAIEVLPGEKYKIIQPRKTPKTRWYGTELEYLRKSGKLDQEYVYNLGIDDLDSRKPVILCEGEKDFIALKCKGYNVFTLGSAVSKIKEYTINLLYQKGIDISKIYILFDTDDTGIAKSKQLSKKHGCRILELPKLQRGGKPTYNDVCDYIKLYGFDEELKELLNLEKFEITKQTSPYHRKINNRLNEDEEFLRDQIFSKEDIFIEAPTRAGKTSLFYSFVKEYIRETNGKIYFAYPSNFANDGQHGLYSNKENNNLGIELSIAKFDQNTPGIEKQFSRLVIEDSDCVNFVYNSFQYVEHSITSNDIIICDEPHKWITQSEITPNNEINKILNCSAKKKYLLLQQLHFHSYKNFHQK